MQISLLLQYDYVYVQIGSIDLYEWMNIRLYMCTVRERNIFRFFAMRE